MSKHVNTSGNYSIKVADGGQITLDTGLNMGGVYLTGNLVVNGTSTTVSSQDLNIKDNIIVLNSAETGAGISVPGGESGIRIERGSLTDVQILFNESITWNDPVSNTTKTGAFVLKDESSNNIGIELTSICTPGNENLNLIGAGTGIVMVDGTNNYENTILNNDPQWDDALTNRKYVDLKIDLAVDAAEFKRIIDVNTDVVVEDTDGDAGAGNPSNVKIRVDNQTHATFYDNRTELHDLRIHNNRIETTISSDNLWLQAPGTGSIVMNDKVNILQQPNPAVTYSNVTFTTSSAGVNAKIDVTKTGGLNSAYEVVIDTAGTGYSPTETLNVTGLNLGGISPHHDAIVTIATIDGSGGILTATITGTPSSNFTDPAAPSDGVELYVKTPEVGKTGLFYVNSSNVRDEILSKNRSILLSMIF